MNDWLLLQLASYGVPLLFFTTYFSCLALPVPASLMMLAAGAFVATGDLTFFTTTGAALIGAILGDQTGYHIGQTGSEKFNRFIAPSPKRTALFNHAHAFIGKWDNLGIFLSRWLISPLGPYVNFASGLTDQNWPRFTLWSILGEIVWVGLYIGLGFGFANNIAIVAEIAGDISGIIAGAAVAIALGLWLRRILRDQSNLKKSQ